MHHENFMCEKAPTPQAGNSFTCKISGKVGEGRDCWVSCGFLRLGVQGALSWIRMGPITLFSLSYFHLFAVIILTALTWFLTWLTSVEPLKLLWLRWLALRLSFSAVNLCFSFFDLRERNELRMNKIHNWSNKRTYLNISDETTFECMILHLNRILI